MVNKCLSVTQSTAVATQQSQSELNNQKKPLLLQGGKSSWTSNFQQMVALVCIILLGVDDHQATTLTLQDLSSFWILDLRELRNVLHAPCALSTTHQSKCMVNQMQPYQIHRYGQLTFSGAGLQPSCNPDDCLYSVVLRIRMLFLAKLVEIPPAYRQFIMDLQTLIIKDGAFTDSWQLIQGRIVEQQ